MRIRKFLWAISDFIYYKLLGGNRSAKNFEKRKLKTLSEIIKIIDETEPYIIDGKWRWYQDDTGFHPEISIVFPDCGLVIMLESQEIGPWDSVKIRCRDKSSWEKANSLNALLQLRCKELGLTLISIAFDDPIDPDSLDLRIKNALLNRKVS